MSVEPTAVLEELLDVGGRDVLEVGCGEGWLVRRLAAAGARAVGLDPSAVALERARRDEVVDHLASYVEGVAQALPFPAASFDIVIFFNSLHHVPEGCMDAALAQVARVLRPGGRLFVQEPLPEGEFFELTRSVEDETRVRAQAQASLERAADGPLVELVRREALITTRFTDFEAFRRRLVSVEPARTIAIDDQEPSLRAAFGRAGRPSDRGREFTQPIRVSLLARLERGQV
jgi:SAM-dependent methyltransferase